MFKFLVTLLICAAVICGAVYVFSPVILKEVSDRAIDYAVKNIKVPNLEYARPSFQSVRLSSPTSVTWSGLTTDVTMVKDEVKNEVERATVQIADFTIDFSKILERSVQLSIKGLSAAKKASGSAASGSQDAGEMLEAGDLKVRLTFPSFKLSDVTSNIRGFTSEVKQFSETGVTKIPIEFSAKETFILKGKPYRAGVRIQQEGNDYRLVMDEDDLKKMGSFGGNIPPTAGDIKLLARNPMRAPQMLRIRDKAETTASLAHKKDPAVPEDAYRHTLWAYLLTKAYGDKFAKEVGDAHESEADQEEMKSNKNFMAASNQDFNNNAVGRSYARRGYKESSILNRVMTDPEVIRDDEMLARYTGSVKR